MSDRDGIRLESVGQIALTARDLDRAIAFYRDTLQLHHLFTAGKMAFFDCGGIRLMLAVPETPEMDHPSSIVYFKVKNIEESTAALEARNVVFHLKPQLIARMPDHELWLAFFKDSEGNTVSLMCEKR